MRSLWYDNIQVQPNTNDCDLFAIAFAITISSGQAPEHLLFDVEQMRSHLTSCFEKKEMNPFPLIEEAMREEKGQLGRMRQCMACKCRLLESNKMVCCDTCSEWYHDTCVECGTLTAFGLVLDVCTL